MIFHIHRKTVTGEISFHKSINNRIEIHTYIVKDSSWVHSKSFSYRDNSIRSAARTELRKQTGTDKVSYDYNSPLLFQEKRNCIYWNRLRRKGKQKEYKVPSVSM
jgi:hypothetical protein